MKVFKLATGLAIGYVLGARAGREKYEQIVAVARKAQGRPTVTPPAVTQAEELTGQADSAPVETTATPLALAGTTPADSAPRPARRRRKSTVPTPGPAADPLT